MSNGPGRIIGIDVPALAAVASHREAKAFAGRRLAPGEGRTTPSW
jgi:hypothetical protein